MKTIYGPVPSWRLGRSLGIDLLPEEKTCPFDCIYCQLGKTIDKTVERQEFVKTETVASDLKKALPKVKADIITFSGNGEPLLASNLGAVGDEIRNLTDLPLAILTSSALIDQENVRKELKKLDLVVAKLEAPTEEFLQKINRPEERITLKKIISGLEKFRSEYSGKLALQVMFLNENKNQAEKIAEIARQIKPDEIQLDTAIRPSPVPALNEEEMKKIKGTFSGFQNVKMVYEEKKPEVEVVDKEKTKKLRPGMGAD